MPPFPKDRHGGVAITWPVTQDGWEVQPGPCGRALLCKSWVKALLRNTANVTPGASVLNCVLASFHDAQHVKKYSEPGSKGSCTAVQKVCATVQAWGRGGGGHRVEGSRHGSPPPPHVFHFFLHDSSQTRPVCKARKSTRAEHRQGYMQTYKKKKKKNTTDVAESKTFKSESFLEEGKVFQIMSKMSLNSTHRRMKRNTQFMWRGGCWLQTFKAVRALLWQVTP